MERLKSHRDFVHVVKQRTKVTSRDLVVHFCIRESAVPDVVNGGVADAGAKRLGLAVSKNVGHAVTRNAVKRRFRVLARAHEATLPAGCDIVMRARPSAAHASFQSLDAQVAMLFAKAAKRLATTQAPVQASEQTPAASSASLSSASPLSASQSLASSVPSSAASSSAQSATPPANHATAEQA